MVIEKLVLGILQTNCYFVINNDECIVIDPATSFEKIINFAKQRNLKIAAVILTHGHFDHVGACKKLQENGIKIYCSAVEAKELINNPKLLGLRESMFFEPDYLIFDGEELNLIGLKIKCFLTSGHTIGSMSYLIGDNLFCGDTIFAGGSYGRCDLYSGDFEKIKHSINKIIFSLNDDTKLYPGHGKSSFVGKEKLILNLF